MPLARRPSAPIALAPGEGRVDLGHRQVLHARRHHRHFAFHAAALVAAADPAAIDAHQERRLSVLGGEAAGSGRGASLLGTLRAGAGGSGTGTGLLSLRLLPLSAKLAMPVGQQPDFFGADLSATQPLE
ncbi:MAG TPA: hypothetical protein VK657_06410, partial [Terriglobales bacterium]|nr:hypothetical protein [Terriglobales bacterium]